MFFKQSFNLAICKRFKHLPLGEYVSRTPILKEQKIQIRNYEMNFLKVGQGPHHVFCAGGIFSSIWNDFEKQIKGLSLDKFSLVIWDPPGYGKSIALDNDDTINTFSRDADIAYELMKALEITKYSVLGFSNGGLVTLLLASRHPDIINKVVAFGTGTFVFPHELEHYKSLRNLNVWPESIRKELTKLYGEENLKTKIEKVIRTMCVCLSSDFKVKLSNEVRRIKCPTFLLHGARDHVVDSWHMRNLKRLIPNSRTHLYLDGKHYIQKQHADDFNKRVQEFLLQTI